MALLNTHTAVKKFVQHGFSEGQAEIIVEVINDQSNELATKSDLFQVKTELKSEIKVLEVSLRSEIAEVRSELKSDIAEVRTELKVLATQFSTIKLIQYSILGVLLAPIVAQIMALYFK
jgi:hypothetical protein